MKAADLKFASRLRGLAPAVAWLLAFCSAAAIAANTDIANAPLFTSSNSQIQPNIMFILDDSGSMLRDYVPDEAGFSMSTYGFRAGQCNGVAYDPRVTYNPPVDATGTVQAAGSTAFMSPASQVVPNGGTNPTSTDPLTVPRSLNSISDGTWPTAVGQSVTVTVSSGSRDQSYATNGTQEVTVYGTTSQFFIGVVTAWNSSTGSMTIKVWDVVGTGGLSTALVAKGVANTYFTYTGLQPKLGYSYNASASLITTSAFYQECSSSIGSTPGSNVFVAHAVGGIGSAVDDAQNYANWQAYYRTRIQMMRTAMTWAFKGIDDRYRVGFTTISSTNATEGTKFLDIRRFDATQKGSFYSKLNGVVVSATTTTPLRGALAKAGRYYANKAPGQALDPIQYSCQRNFTLLSTDGYWNTGLETSTYGPLQLDGVTRVAQQDGGGTLRPMFDGGSVTRTTTETWTVTTVTTSRTTTPSVTTSTLTTSTTTVAPSSTTAGSRRTTYTPVTTSFNVAAANISRTGTTVTVTATNHGLLVGDHIKVTNGNSNASSYRITDGTITAVTANTFTYTDTNASGSPGGTYTYSLGPNLTCNTGQTVQRQITQQSDQMTTTKVFATQTTTTNKTTTFTTTTTDITPHSRVTKAVNGTVVSDTGDVAGTLSSTPVNSTPTVRSSDPVVTVQSGVPATQTSTASTSYATIATDGPLACVSTTNPPTQAVTGTFAPITQATTQAGSTSAGPTSVDGTATVVITSGPLTTESPVPHASVSAVTSSTGGTSNTLADVAMYYYQTDLRTTGLANCIGALGSDVCNNNVPVTRNDAAHSYGDSANWQHMTTFTLGLGASGLLRYDPNYQTQLSGDYFDITNTSRNWPSPVESTSGGEPQNIDDLWHAAVNGRGQYFSAGDPTTLTNSLNSALDQIKAVTGSASAASTSSLQPVQGDNDIYVAQFTTQKWVGDVLSRRIDPTTGQISNTITWSAKAQLDQVTAASRTIYYPNPSGSSTLRTFTYNNLSTDSYGGAFDNFCSKTGASGSGNPQQCAALSSNDRSAANDGRNLVNYLRGDQTLSYYRSRDNLLGDIINASPLYVGKPAFRYSENNYQAFVTANASRQAVVLAAANDGMLHAFNRATGNELWAYVPSFVIRNLYKLADTNYSNNHSYYVDGSPQMGDIFTGGAWKTIVVGGLAAGGRGYYALDVTDPAAPKLLWEYSNDNLGLTFGNPIITKRADGTWVVVFASGYNNVNPGDGNGHLFVLDANTGTRLSDIQTYSSGTIPVGTALTPSGLAKINDWVDSETTNSAKRFYGGDMLGNLWRFDIDGLVPPNNAALRLAQLTGPTGAAQPVTTIPSVAEVNYNGSRFPVVYVATGRYLASTDLSDSNVQTIYAIKDPLANSSYGPVRTNTNFVTQTITASGTDRTSTSNAVDWMSKAGWMADLPAGERVSVDPQLALQTIFVGSNLPNSDSCSAGGKSFLYKFNIATGKSTSIYVGDVMIQGVTLVQLTSGAVEGIVTESTGDTPTFPGDPESSSANLRRTSWRELVE